MRCDAMGYVCVGAMRSVRTGGLLVEVWDSGAVGMIEREFRDKDKY